jgi:hypothetical protein
MLKDLNSSEKQEVLSHNRRYFQKKKNILGIADLFKDVEKFYIPLFFDFRGIIYSNISYFHYQSISLAKALILFAEGGKIINKDNKMLPEINNPDNDDINNISGDMKNPFYWLNIYSANCFGKGAKNLDSCIFGKYLYKFDLDKLSFNDRNNRIKSYHN